MDFADEFIDKSVDFYLSTDNYDGGVENDRD